MIEITVLVLVLDMGNVFNLKCLRYIVFKCMYPCFLQISLSFMNRDAKALQEKTAKKASQDAGENNAGGSKK